MFNDSTTTTISEEEREEYLEGVNWGLMNEVGPFLTYFALLMFAGLIGNCVVIAVYYKRYRPSVTRICVLTMGAVDLSTNVIAIPVEILRVRYHSTFEAAWECKLHWAALSTLIIFSAIVLVIVAVDRRRLICRRAAGQPRSSLTKVKIALAIGLAWSFFLSIPRFVIMGHKTLTFPGTDITGVNCGVEDAYEPTTFVKVYNGILVLLFIALCVAMNVSYGQIGCFLWQHKKKRRQEKPSSGTGDKLRQTSKEDKKAETSFNNIGNGNQQTLSLNPSFNPAGKSEKNHFSGNTTTNNNQPTAFVNPIHPESGPYVDYSTDSALDTSDESRTVDTSTQMSELTSTAVSSSPAGQETPEKRPSYKRSKSQASRPRSHRRSKHGPQGKKIPTRTTLMLFVLSVVFVVNFVPFLVLQMLEKFKPHLTEGIEENIFLVLSNTQYINSAANPLVYSFCSARFRYECRNLFGLKH